MITFTLTEPDYTLSSFQKANNEAGIYILRDISSNPIYIGKANSFKERFAAYINNCSHLDFNVIKTTHHIDIYLVSNKYIREIYETFMINFLNPYYNHNQVVMDENICIDKEGLKRLQNTRELERINDIESIYKSKLYKMYFEFKRCRNERKNYLAKRHEYDSKKDTYNYEQQKYNSQLRKISELEQKLYKLQKEYDDFKKSYYENDKFGKMLKSITAIEFSSSELKFLFNIRRYFMSNKDEYESELGEYKELLDKIHECEIWVRAISNGNSKFKNIGTSIDLSINSILEVGNILQLCTGRKICDKLCEDKEDYSLFCDLQSKLWNSAVKSAFYTYFEI